jgi:hypothetical protein
VWARLGASPHSRNAGDALRCSSGVGGRSVEAIAESSQSHRRCRCWRGRVRSQRHATAASGATSQPRRHGPGDATRRRCRQRGVRGRWRRSQQQRGANKKHALTGRHGSELREAVRAVRRGRHGALTHAPRWIHPPTRWRWWCLPGFRFAQRGWRAAERRLPTGPREDGLAHPAATSRSNLAAFEAAFQTPLFPAPSQHRVDACGSHREGTCIRPSRSRTRWVQPPRQRGWRRRWRSTSPAPRGAWSGRRCLARATASTPSPPSACTASCCPCTASCCPSGANPRTRPAAFSAAVRSDI